MATRGTGMVGFEGLVRQVEAMVEGGDGAAGFDARGWLERWLAAPAPALGNTRPIDLMGTVEGRSLVSRTLAQIESGAYA